MNHLPLRLTSTLFLWWLCLLGSIGQLQAQLIVAESFDTGTPGSDLHDFPSGNFSYTDWEVQNDNINGGYLVVDSNPLIYEGLASSPAYATGGEAFLFSGIPLQGALVGPFGQASANYTTPDSYIGYNGTTSETLWMSFLARNDQAGNNSYRLGLNESSAGYFCEVRGDGNANWRLRVDNVDYPTATPVVTEEVTLIVLKLDFIDATTSTISMYVNPGDLGGTAPATADTSVTYTGTFRFRYLKWRPGTAPDQGSIDEIRFGSTYASVTPPGNFTLDLSTADGTVTIDPIQPYYADGDVVELTASPALGFQFDSWSGDATGNANPLQLTMDENKQVTANFVPGDAPPAYLPGLYELIPNHQLLLPVHLLLGDSTLFSNSLTFAFNSSDPTVISNPTAIYQAGDQTVVLAFDGSGQGSSLISVDISDGGNVVASAEFDLSVVSQVRADNGGIRYVASDVAHWQPRPYQKVVTPKTGYPVTLGQSYNVWLQSQASGQAEIDANWFFHGIMSGIIIPKETGTYTFEVEGDGEGNPTLWLAEGLTYDNFPTEVNPIEPTNFTAYVDSPGTVTLQAGTSYYFEAHHRQIVNDWEIEVQWTTPSDNNLRRLTNADVALYVDTELPTAPTALNATLGETVAQLAWGESSDNDEVAGYHVFVNGARVNDSLLTTRNYYVEDLVGNTAYEFAVVAVDVFGNHSFPSDLLRLSTPAASSSPSPVPTGLQADVITAFKAEISWDVVPNALGYNVYLDGSLVNAIFIAEDSFVIRGLRPETTYQVELRSLNVSLLESASAASLSVTTLPFDALNPDEDVYLFGSEVTLEPVVKANGLMINLNQNPNSALLREDRLVFDTLMAELQPAGFRFGAITANSISFSEASGANPDFVTYGEFAQASLDAGGNAVALTVGPGPDEDYITNPTQAFTQFMEYLGGDASTSGGTRRAAEGFQDPFTDRFDHVVIELGNEVWGGNAHDSPIGSDYNNDYLPWVQQVTDIITSSPYYDADKMEVVISARSPRFPGFQNPIFNAAGTILNDSFPYVLGLSGYVGGNIMDAGEDFGSITNNRLAYHKESYNVMFKYLNAIREINDAALATTGRTWPFFPYECNTTQNTYHGSLGQALLTIDYLQEYQKRGGFLPGLFTLEDGQWRMITQNADGSYQRRPLFEVTGLLNRMTRGGTMVRTVPSTVRRAVTPGGTEYNLLPVGFHAYNRGTEYAVTYFSRDFEHDYIAKLDLPDGIGTITNGRITILTGDNFDASQTQITIDSSATITDGMLIDVPRYSMVVISFEANDPALEAPLFVQQFEEEDSVTSIAQTSTGLKPLSVYPSPTRGQDAQLVLRGYGGQQVQVALLDATGRQVAALRRDIDHPEAVMSLPTANLLDGVYVISVQGTKDQHSVRLWVQH